MNRFAIISDNYRGRHMTLGATWQVMKNTLINNDLSTTPNEMFSVKDVYLMDIQDKYITSYKI